MLGPWGTVLTAVLFGGFKILVCCHVEGNGAALVLARSLGGSKIWMITCAWWRNSPISWRCSSERFWLDGGILPVIANSKQWNISLETKTLASKRNHSNQIFWLKLTSQLPQGVSYISKELKHCETMTITKDVLHGKCCAGCHLIWLLLGVVHFHAIYFKDYLLETTLKDQLKAISHSQSLCQIHWVWTMMIQ